MSCTWIDIASGTSRTVTVVVTPGTPGTNILSSTITADQPVTSSANRLDEATTVNPSSAPTVTSFTPAIGPVGTSVTLAGSNFTGSTQVKFNGITASFTILSDSAITTTVPSGATDGPISVTNAIGTGTSATNFTVGGPPTPPTVSSFVATPSTITSGNSSTLSWTTTNATSVTIDNGVGAKPVSGSVSVSPTVTTTYTLTATGPGGSITATATVTLSAAGVPGDANGDGTVSVRDVFYLINHLFVGGLAPIGPGDANGDAAVTVGDVFYLINFLFQGGPPPR